MTTNENQLALHIVHENYGNLAKSVVALLLKKKSYPFLMIADELDIEVKLVSHVISTLIIHDLIEYKLTPKQIVEYKFSTRNTLSMLKIQNYGGVVRSLCGEQLGPYAESIVYEVFRHGYLQMSSTLLILLHKHLNSDDKQKAFEERKLDATYVSLTDAFKWLATKGYIVQCARVDDHQPMEMDAQPVSIKDLPKVPRFIVAKESYLGYSFDQNTPELVVPESKKLEACKSTAEDISYTMRTENFGDQGLYWRINHLRFFQHYRDVALVTAIENRIDKNAANILAAMLRLADTNIVYEKAIQSTFQSKPVTTIDVQKVMRNEHQMDSSTVDKYINVIMQDTFRVIEKVGDFSGGTYYIDFKKSAYNICVAHIESYVKERYGSKSLRIFKVIMDKLQIEMKQIEDFSMIPSKECKALVYNMLNDAVLNITELSKTTDHVASRTYYLFHVDVHQLARKLLDNAYKAMFNLMLKREQLSSENKRLLEKSNKMNIIVESLVNQEADQAEIDEEKAKISPEELHQLNSVTEHCNKIELAEIQLQEGIFVYENYFYYHTIAPVIPAKK